MKYNNRKIMLLIIILISGFSMVAYGQLNDFESHWAGEVIGQWLKKGLTRGYSDGIFRPNNYLLNNILLEM